MSHCYIYLPKCWYNVNSLENISQKTPRSECKPHLGRHQRNVLPHNPKILMT